MLCKDVVVIDLENVWQHRRARKLRSLNTLVLEDAIWEIGAFDAVLLDWLDTAPQTELQGFRALEANLMLGLFSGAPYALCPRFRWYAHGTCYGKHGTSETQRLVSHAQVHSRRTSGRDSTPRS